MLDSSSDPLGLALRARARQTSEDYANEQRARDPFWDLSLAGMSQKQGAAQSDASGWGGFFQALKESAQKLAGPNAKLKLVGFGKANPPKKQQPSLAGLQPTNTDWNYNPNFGR